MNNNQIKNNKVEVAKGTNFNDKDYMNSILSCLKDMCKNYTVALTEASCENLYNKYMEMFLKYSKMQREIYEAMFRRGWYILETAEQTKINNKHQTLNQELIDLNG